MFADAIEYVGGFTRPVKFITRNYGTGAVLPGTATLFFVNDEGWALTCRHVAHMMISSAEANKNYNEFKKAASEVAGSPKAKVLIKSLEKKYGLDQNKPAQIKLQFPDCFDRYEAIDITPHPKYDIALLHFRGYEKILYKGHAVFGVKGTDKRPGDYFVRLGFPFPEFRDFAYDEEHDDIVWTGEGRIATPRFPIDGMYTRNIADDTGRITGIELSTPGLRGQSGGPLFDEKGVVYGIQSTTRHLHLGFDMVNEEMVFGGKKQKVNNQPFLHVGQCINLSVIMEFMDNNHVKYFEGTTPENAVSKQQNI
ncbi:MAG: trypsin-like peptidase domain-containing protein [Firmicutes bacterium]|nr:trypsin-like peptidase domain-containing protein [Bacillota bacterium]